MSLAWPTWSVSVPSACDPFADLIYGHPDALGTLGFHQTQVAVDDVPHAAAAEPMATCVRCLLTPVAVSMAQSSVFSLCVAALVQARATRSAMTARYSGSGLRLLPIAILWQALPQALRMSPTRARS
jgi:hypothetical protein